MAVYFPHARDGMLNEPSAMDDVRLLAGVLGGESGKEHPLAQDLLARFGSLAAVICAPPQMLCQVRGMGRGRCRRLQLVRELARRDVLRDLTDTNVLDNASRTRQFLRWHLAHREREVFCCLFLNSQHHLICCEDLFLGTLDGAAVYPREVVGKALQYGAAAVIFAHNHPSGVSEPSVADRRITERLQAALALVDVRVLDHFIIGKGRSFSFAEAGFLG